MTTMNTEPGEREHPDPKKAGAGRKGGLKRQENWRRGVKECETCGKLSADLNKHPCFIAAHNAATRMRERCVDAIKSLRATPHGAAYNNAINDAIHKVESLTLDGGRVNSN